MSRLRCLRGFALVGLAVLSSVMPLAARAAEDPVAIVERVQGDVSLLHAGTTSKAVKGAAIFVGDHLGTDPRARVQIALADHTQIVLGGNAEIAVAEYELSPNAKSIALVQVTKGPFRVDSAPGTSEDAKTQVIVPLATVAGHGAFWGGPTGDTYGVTAFEGRVDVSNDAGAMSIDKKLGTTLRPGQPPSKSIEWPEDKLAHALSAVAFDDPTLLAPSR